MKTTIIATLVAFFNIGISSVSAKCYGSSDKVFWQDPGNACWHAERACRGYDGIQGAFQGVYSPGQVKYACVQGTGTQKYEFSVQNLNGNAAFDLEDDHCVSHLFDEINGCIMGGESTISGWHFR
jgi:hypothetical protein